MRVGNWRGWMVVGVAVALGWMMPVSRASAASLRTLLPATGAVAGWKMVGAPKDYGPDTLYDLIDGGADAVKEYAFLSCVDARYSPNGRPNPSIDVNVYDMSNPLKAFGLFSLDREGSQPVNVGAGGARTTDGTGMSFWKGRYLIRLASISRSAQFKNGMLTLARAVAARIHGSSAQPELLQKLPPGMKSASEKYVKANVAGHAFVSNAVTARYPALGATAELFIAQFPSAAGARAAYQKYLAYEKGNRDLAPLKGETGFSVLDRFARNVVVAARGPYLVGVVRATNMPKAQALVRAAAAKLK